MLINFQLDRAIYSFCVEEKAADWSSLLFALAYPESCWKMTSHLNGGKRKRTKKGKMSVNFTLEHFKEIQVHLKCTTAKNKLLVNLHHSDLQSTVTPHSCFKPSQQHICATHKDGKCTLHKMEDNAGPHVTNGTQEQLPTSSL